MNASQPNAPHPSSCCQEAAAERHPTAVSSLDPSESPVHSSPQPPQTQPAESQLDPAVWRHSCWFRDRARVYDALVATYAPPSRLERFALCGSDAWVVQDVACPEHLRVQANFCHDRWCVPCGRARARLVANNLRGLVGDVPHRFITLTIRAENEPLVDRIRHLYDSFRRIRRSRRWQQCIDGGVAFCEPCWSDRSNCWHVHLHIVAHGRFITQRELSALWLQATGDSYIVDIRLIRGHDKAVDYVTKYAAKPLEPATLRNHDRLCEAMLALKGRRLILPFGDWSRVKLTAVTHETEWRAVAPLSELLQRAAAGDAWASHVLRVLKGAYASCNLDTTNVPP